MLIDHPAGGLRYMVHTFDLEDGGVAWVDSGWTDPLASSHVCHYLQGSVITTERGWLLSTPEGEEVPIHPDARELPLEGDRDIARQDIQRSFEKLILRVG
ncbi:MAG: hypothetical protein IPG06_17790 [Haliea sp.]|nr:hypothetical protein [Haliea sp.]